MRPLLLQHRGACEGFRSGQNTMTLTVFIAICILGCDLLIYFLFQWTLGEKGRTKRRRGGSKRRLAEGQETELFVVRGSAQNDPSRPKVLPYQKSEARKRSWLKDDCETSEQVTEEMAYRRRVAAFATLK